MNRTHKKFVIYQGREIPLVEAVRLSDTPVHIKTVNSRLEKGWPLLRALDRPTAFDSPRRADGVRRLPELRRRG